MINKWIIPFIPDVYNKIKIYKYIVWFLSQYYFFNNKYKTNLIGTWFLLLNILWIQREERSLFAENWD